MTDELKQWVSDKTFEKNIRASERWRFAKWLFEKRYILTNDNPTVAWYLCENLNELMSEYEKEHC